MLAKDKKILFILEFLAAFLLIAAITILAALKNNGLEGDEVFSYISSTSMGGFKKICYLEDQTWYGADYFKDAVTATGEERFNIKMVRHRTEYIFSSVHRGRSLSFNTSLYP